MMRFSLLQFVLPFALIGVTGCALLWPETEVRCADCGSPPCVEGCTPGSCISHAEAWLPDGPPPRDVIEWGDPHRAWCFLREGENLERPRFFDCPGRDGTVQSFSEYFYDDEGRLESIERRQTARPERVTRRAEVTWEEGRVVMFAWFDTQSNLNPPPPTISRFGYVGGRLLSRVTTSEFNDSKTETTLTLHANTDSISQVEIIRSYGDPLEEQSTTTNTFDSFGRALSRIRLDRGGSNSQVITYSYDDDTGLLAREVERIATAETSRIRLFFYDDGGELTRVDLDSNGDGAIDSSENVSDNCCGECFPNTA